MGLGADAELIWGVPIVSHDDEGEPTLFWDDDEGDWREFEGLEISGYGHYEDPDASRAILTTEAIPRFLGECWDPTHVPDRALDVEAYHDDAVQAFMNRVLALDEALAERRGWWLVASFG